MERKISQATDYQPAQNQEPILKSKGGQSDMNKIFYDSTGEIDKELLDSKARTWALSFIKPEWPKDKRKRNPELKSTQLRRFHNDIRELEAKVDAAFDSEGEVGFKKMLPRIKMVKSKVAYACPSDGRDRKVPDEFRKYMETMINNIETKKDFEAFSLCFEAVVGYFFGEGGRK